MKSLKILFFAVAMAGLALTAEAVPPTEPGAVLVSGQNDAAWQPLFAQLAPQGPVFSTFTERRRFPFRREPVQLQGEMRLHPQRGLSLRYVQPEERMMIVDRAGMLQRDKRGRTRAVPSDPQVTALNSALLPVLQFDQAEILRRFEILAARDGDDWRLDFVPRDPTLARTLGRLITWGRGDRLERIEFRRSEKQRVEIVIETAERNVTFSEADLTRFFR